MTLLCRKGEEERPRNETKKKEEKNISCVHKESEKKFILCTSREGLVAHEKYFRQLPCRCWFFRLSFLLFQQRRPGVRCLPSHAPTQPRPPLFSSLLFLLDSRNLRKRIVYAIWRSLLYKIRHLLKQQHTHKRADRMRYTFMLPAIFPSLLRHSGSFRGSMECCAVPTHTKNSLSALYLLPKKKILK